MLLKYDTVGELFATDGTHVDGTERRLGTVDAHVGLEVALGGEGTPAEPTAERPLTGVRTIVHQQRAAAAQTSKTDNTLIHIDTSSRSTRRQVVDVRRLSVDIIDFHELLQWVHGCPARRR